MTAAPFKDSDGFEKDRVLDALARDFNVAQFVGFAPDLSIRFSRVRGFEPNARFEGPDSAVRALLRASEEKSVNLRSYTPHQPRSRRFVYGVRSAEEASAALRSLAAEGLFVVVNETVDVHDGGVSGAAAGAVVEFAPDDTPRCVEQPGVATLDRETAVELLKTVYGVDVSLATPKNRRVEFSLHPRRRGVRGEHVLVWESEPFDASTPFDRAPTWPNRFSRFLGDKAFGLLVASVVGLPVPRTTVIARRVRPFSFGIETGSTESWLRTCPNTQEPGRFTTLRGYADPFRLLMEEDPDGDRIASVLSQQAVDAAWSGAALTSKTGGLVVEAVRGSGDAFMLGRTAPEAPPPEVARRVQDLWATAKRAFGPVRFEWADDGGRAWILQLHSGASDSEGDVIVSGDADGFERFDASLGLENLRAFVESLPARRGVVLRGDVGLTSHLADVLRKAKVPSRIERT
jgi:hypothetical protein